MSRPALFAVLVSAGALACTPAVYQCESDENCISRGVQGICEASGFCSYPDDTCEAGQRYDEFAGDGLARDCVPTEDSTSDGGCVVPDCVDRDGDGYGVGADCVGPDCDDDNPAHADACVYVVPGGNDDAAGTIEAPWGTLDRAIRSLTPGTSLVLLDGVYEPSTTGMLVVTCGEGGNAMKGTADQPIGVRAANERAAELRSGGTTTAVYMDSCGSWRLHGLRATGGDLRGSEGGTQSSVMSVSGSNDIEIRRILLTHNNRIFNTELLAIQGSTDVLVEEAEAYFFHRAAFLVYESDRVTFRRCYAHSRDHADLPDCSGDVDPEVAFCSEPGDGGDSAFSIYRDVTAVAFENCAVEGRVGSGVHVGDRSNDVAVRGSIVLGDSDYGVLVGAALEGSSVVGTTVEDTLVVAPRAVGVYFRSSTDTRAIGLSVLRSGIAGLSADENSVPLCADIPGGCSFTAERVHVQDSAGAGFAATTQDPWSIESCNAYGNATDFPVDEDIADDIGNVRHSLSVDANLGTAVGQCAVYVPAGSPLAGAAADGDDIGATILWRIEGTLTDVPLWDPDTGVFPCGAIVAGVNDDPSMSCTGLHTRLNVFDNGCERPPGYASTCE